MKEFKYELLAKSKTTNAVFSVLTNDRTEAQQKAKSAAAKGFPVLVIGHDENKKQAVTYGPQADWKQFRRIVEVTFGGKDDCFTYTCDDLWEVGDARFVKTPKGIRMAVVKTDARLVHVSAVVEIERRIGYSLKKFEDVIA